MSDRTPNNADFDTKSALFSLKNSVFSTRKETAEIRSRRNEFPGWYEFIFLHNRKRLLPKNADLTYMPSNLIEHGEASRLPKPLRWFVTSLNADFDTKSALLLFAHKVLKTRWSLETAVSALTALGLYFHSQIL